ncbi:MAG: NADH-quinone oxidoreductase subunit J [Deltaproteobacteria bacterium]|nr:NADH-quinone oxidoreductase subunit J [Deltaproteobacteria bacterium]
MSMDASAVHALFFYFFAAMTIVSALLVVLLRNIVRSAFSLFFTLFGVAGVYILLGADFVGVAQVLIYIGGVMILIVFGVMLTHNSYSVDMFNRLGTLVMGTVSAIVTFTIVYYSIRQVPWLLSGYKANVPTTQPIGVQLLTNYLLPFELASVLLVFAMVGAAYLIRSEVRPGKERAGGSERKDA